MLGGRDGNPNDGFRGEAGLHGGTEKKYGEGGDFMFNILETQY